MVVKIDPVKLNHRGGRLLNDQSRLAPGQGDRDTSVRKNPHSVDHSIMPPHEGRGRKSLESGRCHRFLPYGSVAPQADPGGLPGSGRWRTGPRSRAATSRIGPSELALANARAIEPTAFHLQKVTWPIELVLEERIVDAKGNVRQPEWKCDGAMVDRINRA